jgi:beta-phosphoglucomutase
MRKDLGVIFDMDGVIINSNPTHSEAWKQYLKTYGVDASDEDLRNHMFGKSNSYIIGYFLKKEFSKKELNEMQTEKEAIFRDIFKNKFELVEGVGKFIESLIEHQIPTGVATSAPRANMYLTIERLPIVGKFQSKMGEEDVKHHKPDPEVYLQSAKNLGLNPLECLVFEDSSSGIMAGKNAGMKVVGVLTSFKKEELPACDFYINDYSEMNIEIVKSILFGE